MSAQTIKAFQAFTGKRPSAAEELKTQAAKLRKRAAGLLAQANELDELAKRMEQNPTL